MNTPYPAEIAPNFPELATRWTAVPDQYRQNALAMLELAQRARSIGGVSVRVGSWYRSKLTNALAGGAEGSQHLTASAMDLTPAGDVRAWFDRVAAQLDPRSFGQLIFERDHVHLSLANRANGRTGEILLEPREGVYIPVPGLPPADDSREGAVNPATTGIALIVALLLIVLFMGEK